MFICWTTGPVNQTSILTLIDRSSRHLNKKNWTFQSTVQSDHVHSWIYDTTPLTHVSPSASF